MLPNNAKNKEMQSFGESPNRFAHLSPTPSGVDFEAAAALGIPTIQALSLPAKTAPVTAGEIVAETVLAMCGGGDADA